MIHVEIMVHLFMCTRHNAPEYACACHYVEHQHSFPRAYCTTSSLISSSLSLLLSKYLSYMFSPSPCTLPSAELPFIILNLQLFNILIIFVHHWDFYLHPPPRKTPPDHLHNQSMPSIAIRALQWTIRVTPKSWDEYCTDDFTRSFLSSRYLIYVYP